MPQACGSGLVRGSSKDTHPNVASQSASPSVLETSHIPPALNWGLGKIPSFNILPPPPSKTKNPNPNCLQRGQPTHLPPGDWRLGLLPWLVEESMGSSTHVPSVVSQPPLPLHPGDRRPGLLPWLAEVSLGVGYRAVRAGCVGGLAARLWWSSLEGLDYNPQ